MLGVGGERPESRGEGRLKRSRLLLVGNDFVFNRDAGEFLKFWHQFGGGLVTGPIQVDGFDRRACVRFRGLCDCPTTLCHASSAEQCGTGGDRAECDAKFLKVLHGFPSFC